MKSSRKSDITILCVDDDGNYLKLLQQEISDEGYNVMTATNLTKVLVMYNTIEEYQNSLKQRSPT